MKFRQIVRILQGSHMTFQRKLTLALLASSLFMALYTSLSSYKLATNEFRQMSIQLTEDNVQMADTVLSDYLDKIYSWTTQTLNCPAMRSLANEESPNRIEIAQYSPSISVSVRMDVAEANDDGVDFTGVEVYMDNGYAYSTYNSDQLFSSYDECLAYFSDQGLNTGSSYVGMQWGLCQTGGKTSLCCLRFIYNSFSVEKIGAAVFVLNEPEISALYTSLVDTAYIVNQYGLILSSPKIDEIGTVVDNPALLGSIRADHSGGSLTYKDEEGHEVLAAYQPVMNLRAYLVVPYKSYTVILQTELTSYVRSVLLMTLAGILAALFMTYLFSRSLSRSILSLTSFIKNVDGQKRSKLRFKKESEDEIAQIGEKINEMLDKLQSATEMRESDLKSNQKLELSLIRSQINPHLLYNTLNSVLWNLQNHDTGDATALITSLSEYFKLSLSKGRQMIPMSDELSLIGHYIEIQHLARHQDITLKLDIPQELYSYPIMKLTMQPIVENAILHGFAGYRDDGTITISASRDDGVLKLVVRDNGIGILPEELEALNTGLQVYPPDPEMRSFGLYNINRSIVQNFGAGYGMKITSEVSVYTCVTIMIPDYENETSSE